MSDLDEFLKILHPNKTLDEIKINPKEFDKKPLDDKPKSRKEKRFNERHSEKKNKRSSTKPIDLKLAKIKADTKLEIGKRLDTIIFGIDKDKKT